MAVTREPVLRNKSSIRENDVKFQWKRSESSIKQSFVTKFVGTLKTRMKRSTNHREVGLKILQILTCDTSCDCSRETSEGKSFLEHIRLLQFAPLHVSPLTRLFPMSPPPERSLPCHWPQLSFLLPFLYRSVLCTHIAKFFGSWYKIVPILRIGLPMGNTTSEQASLHYWSWESKSVWSTVCTFLTAGLKARALSVQNIFLEHFAQPEKSHKVHSAAPLPFCCNFFYSSDFCCFPKDYQIFPVLKFCVSSGRPYLAVCWRLHNSSAIPQTFSIFQTMVSQIDPLCGSSLWIRSSALSSTLAPHIISLLTRRPVFSGGQPTTLCLALLFLASAHAVQYISPGQCNKDC